MPRLHVMIDLETLSTQSDAVVTQLGWVLFEEAGEIRQYAQYDLQVQPQIDMGRRIDWSAISWWLLQDEMPRKALAIRTNALPADEALRLLETRVPWIDVSGVWSNGASFDIAILDTLHYQLKLKAPWPFRNVRDTRTLWDLSRPVVEPNTMKHSALNDALYQARGVIAAQKEIASWKSSALLTSTTRSLAASNSSVFKADPATAVTETSSSSTVPSQPST